VKYKNIYYSKKSKSYLINNINSYLIQIDFNLDVSIKIYVDHVSAINLEKNLVFHQRIKHIDIRYHFIRDQVEKNMIKFKFKHEDCSKSELMNYVDH